MKLSLLLLLALASPSSILGASVPRDSNGIPVITPQSTDNEANYSAPYFPLLGFEKYAANPILTADTSHAWESRAVFNPSAIVVDKRVWLLYRAQDITGKSSIGIAWSSDGIHFTRSATPILEATESYETSGGCEDPRVVRVNGTFYLTYTGVENSLARLCLATSTNLVDWKKHGPILPDISDVVYDFLRPFNGYLSRHGWSKSGAILNERQLDGRYYMHFGESYLYTAYSTDLIHWHVSTSDDTLAGLLHIADQPAPYAPKLNIWEQGLMESGPPPIKTRDGRWLKVYNGVSTGVGGFASMQYNTGQMLIDPGNFPLGPPIARLELPMLEPETGHRVVFSEGLVQFHGQWFLYFGIDDSSVGVAVAPVQP
ncbi:hypothetical protein ARAM_001650 [Aspergillus rambellii]|uniref:Glycosyl hydrolase family 32 N-terminal domain-containing protein n=1 Tax=Aspergillus rambellii TaxID=308745 RepID=A0A0F8UJC3_9EURO|nr:hypothetical protein ARAM_001650 [Aspergillus rambellii]